MKDKLTIAFERYLIHAKKLLLICAMMKQADANIQMLRLIKEEGEKPKLLVIEKDCRDIRIGISRVTYYLNKIKNMDIVEVSFVKEAKAEIYPICEYLKKHMEL